MEVTFFAAVPLPAFPTAGDSLCYSIKFIFFIEARFLAFVRSSGSGKSSAVKAGLLPALRKGAQPGSDQWFSIEMLPGPHPAEELEIACLGSLYLQNLKKGVTLTRETFQMLPKGRDFDTLLGAVPGGV